MKLSKISREELETMSYDDIAYKILEEENKKMKLPDLFKKVCELLDLDESEYEARIADFFQLISRDHRFTMLDKGFWDLKEKYKAKIIMDSEDDDEVVEEDNQELSEDEDSETSTTYYDEDSDEDDVADDDLKDLVIISDDDDEANMN